MQKNAYLGSEGQSDDSNCMGVIMISKDKVMYGAMVLAECLNLQKLL